MLPFLKLVEHCSESVSILFSSRLSPNGNTRKTEWAKNSDGHRYFLRSLARLDACLTCSLLSRDNLPYVPFRCCGLSVPSKSTMDFHCRSRSPHSTVHVTSLIMLFLTVTERPSHYAISLVLRCARLCQYINASKKKTDRGPRNAIFRLRTH